MPSHLVQLFEAKTNEDAVKVIESWLDKPSIPVTMGVMAGGRNCIDVTTVVVKTPKGTANPDDISIMGFIKNLKKRGQLWPSTEIILDQASAKALVAELQKLIK